MRRMKTFPCGSAGRVMKVSSAKVTSQLGEDISVTNDEWLGGWQNREYAMKRSEEGKLYPIWCKKKRENHG